MNLSELRKALARGEDSSQQFKADVKNPESLAGEMVAFSNAAGGRIFIGVSDEGEIVELLPQETRRLNQLIANTATNNVRPPVNPHTENITTPSGVVMIVTIAKGVSPPYADNNGAIWVKNGADKRRVTAREELQRMFQAAGLVHADETPVARLTVADLDTDAFEQFFEKEYGEKVEDQEKSLPDLLRSMQLMADERLNLACALLFSRDPQRSMPAFVVKAVTFPGVDIAEEYVDSQDIVGRLPEMHQGVMDFLRRNLRYLQNGKGVNTTGSLEIPQIALEELVVNALVHRDYFVSAAVRLFVYADRVEIISPGCLPNNLTVESIRRGTANIRNPLLASYATSFESKLLPYRGLGTGIRRALKEYPDIEFEDDREGNSFRVTLHRQ